MEISFVGHACFRLRGREASVVIDPYGKGLGLTTLVPSKFGADVLAIPHDHPGHSNRAMVGGDPFVITAPGEYEVTGVGVRGVAAYHDNESGAKLGNVTLFAITVAEVVAAHHGALRLRLPAAHPPHLATAY